MKLSVNGIVILVELFTLFIGLNQYCLADVQTPTATVTVTATSALNTERNQSVPKSTGLKPSEKSRRLFDIGVSFPLNFVYAQYFYNNPAQPSSLFSMNDFNYRANIDYFLFDDLTLGLYFEGISFNKESSYTYAQFDSDVYGFGIRVKKEFSIAGLFSLEPYLCLGDYEMINYLNSTLTASALGGDVGLDVVVYLNTVKDFSLQAGAGYRVVPLSSLNFYDRVSGFNYSSPTVISFSGWYINFIQLEFAFTK